MTDRSARAARFWSGIVASAADSAVLDPLRIEAHCLAGAGGLEPPNGGIKIRHMVINLSTVPEKLLVAADEVIE